MSMLLFTVEPQLYDFLGTVKKRQTIRTTITPTNKILRYGFARNFNVNYQLVCGRAQKPKSVKKVNAKTKDAVQVPIILY